MVFGDQIWRARLENALGIVKVRSHTRSVLFPPSEFSSILSPRAVAMMAGVKSKYPVMRMGALVTDFMRGRGGRSLRVSGEMIRNSKCMLIKPDDVHPYSGVVLKRALKSDSEWQMGYYVAEGCMIYCRAKPNDRRYFVCKANTPHPVVCSSDFFVFRPCVTKIRSDYLALALSIPWLDHQFSTLLAGRRTGKLMASDFIKLLIPVPPIAEQDRIVKQFR